MQVEIFDDPMKSNGFRVITLRRGHHVYKSIIDKYSRDSVFDYSLFRDAMRKRCKIISWFALSYEKAEYYRLKSKRATVYEYNVKRDVNLIIANNVWNLKLFSTYARKKAENLAVLTKMHFTEIPYDVRNRFESYSYLRMTPHARAVHEYKFAFGFLSRTEQLKFIKLIFKLQEYGIIPNLTQMSDKQSVFMANKWVLRGIRAYYNVIRRFSKYKSPKDGQRFSIYDIDKNVTYNMCIVWPKNVHGYVYVHEPSIWHAKMTDTSEITVFDPIKFLN